MAKSTQAIFVYLDDTHKACNKQYADLLGYKSAKESADIDAPLADVKEKDQPKGNFGLREGNANNVCE